MPVHPSLESLLPDQDLRSPSHTVLQSDAANLQRPEELRDILLVPAHESGARGWILSRSEVWRVRGRSVDELRLAGDTLGDVVVRHDCDMLVESFGVRGGYAEDGDVSSTMELLYIARYIAAVPGCVAIEVACESDHWRHFTVTSGSTPKTDCCLPVY
jgi:hypothetical protein